MERRMWVISAGRIVFERIRPPRVQVKSGSAERWSGKHFSDPTHRKAPEQAMAVEIVNYTPALTADLVNAVNLALAPLRDLPRVNPEGPELGIYTHADLIRRFEQGLVDPDCSHAALVDGVPVAVAECRTDTAHDVAGLGWVLTHPQFAGRGLARRCLEQCLVCVGGRGVTEMRTIGIIDSRWTGACAFLERLGFEAHDPEHSNILMQIDIKAYEPREPILPAGYRIVTYHRGDEEHWARLKTVIFGDETRPEYFLDTFAARHDFDPQGWLFVERGEEKVGFTGAMICRNRQTGAVTGGQIHWVGATPEERGKGLGEALMIAGLNYFKAFDADPCILQTQPFRVPAVKLYEKLGFKYVRAERTYVKKL